MISLALDVVMEYEHYTLQEQSSTLPLHVVVRRLFGPRMAMSMTIFLHRGQLWLVRRTRSFGPRNA